jgi:hypothetical protein
VAPLRQVIASTSGEPKIPDQYSVPAYSQAKKTPKIAIFPKRRLRPFGYLSGIESCVEAAMLDRMCCGVIAVSLGLSSCVCSPGGANMSHPKSSGLVSTLHADGPVADRAAALELYGQFVGDWDTDIVTYTPDGVRHQGQGEIHFGWILEGRAIQDVWMIPRRKDRGSDAAVMPVAGNWFGTTIRAYDPTLDAWRIYWIDPATNSYRQQIGRKQGVDIVQEGMTESGMLSRWSFTEIRPQSFHWKGEASKDKGASWHLLVEVFAHRMPT